MKLSLSNIAWSAEQDEKIYQYLYSQDFSGLEIAPTRLFPDTPYESLDEAWAFAENLRERYGLYISSIQSIYFGRSESIFGSESERQALVLYTKKAVDFAVAVRCGNLVFGCPKNRNMPYGADIRVAYDFFAEIAEYAITHGTVVALEPNPPIYNTNFINTTVEAFNFCKRVNGLKVNIDCGTIIENGEDIRIVADNIGLMNHIHISEPNLARIEKRDLHRRLAAMLRASGYDKYVSVEMKKLDDIEVVKQTIEYVKEIFI